MCDLFHEIVLRSDKIKTRDVIYGMIISLLVPMADIAMLSLENWASKLRITLNTVLRAVNAN